MIRAEVYCMAAERGLALYIACHKPVYAQETARKRGKQEFVLRALAQIRMK